MARPIAPETPPDEALRRIAADCRDDLLKHRIVVLKSRRAIGIHQTRVALRRLRAALGVFRDAVAGESGQRALKALAADAKWLASECAPARDLHVLLTETLDDVPAPVTRIARRLARVHLAQARAALDSTRFATFDKALAAFVAEAPAAIGRLDDFSRAMLEDRHARVLKRARRFGTLDGERLHRLRIAIKKLRYAATFLRPAFASREAKAYIEATARLQGVLGLWNDHDVAAGRLVEIARAARPRETVEQAIARLTRQAASGARRRRHRLERAWKNFRKVEPFWRA